MAAYSSLSAEDQLKVRNLMAACREWGGMMARLCKLGQAIEAYGGAGALAVAQSLNAGVIDAPITIEGSDQLTKDQLLALEYHAKLSSAPTQAEGLLTTYNTAYLNTIYVAAVGVYNTLQQGPG